MGLVQPYTDLVFSFARDSWPPGLQSRVLQQIAPHATQLDPKLEQIDIEQRPYRGQPFSYKNDPAVPLFPDDRPIIIFDGHCVLCSRFARFVLRHDRRGLFRLTAAQTPLGQSLFRHLGLDPVNFETNVLLENGQAHFKSDGTIRMFAHLGFPWSMALLARLVPRPLRDRLYDLIAKNRFKWFGSQSVCFSADPSHRDRFLE